MNRKKNNTMPEETEQIPKGIEVQETVVQRGTVGLSFKNPAPDKLKRVIAALTYFCAGLMTTVGATDLFSGRQAKIICFILGIVILALGALGMTIGVKPAEEK